MHQETTSLTKCKRNTLELHFHHQILSPDNDKMLLQSYSPNLTKTPVSLKIIGPSVNSHSYPTSQNNSNYYTQKKYAKIET